MTANATELYLIDAHDFDGSEVHPLSQDRRVLFTGYLYNDKGPDLSVDAFLAHPRTRAFTTPMVVTWEELEPMIEAAHRRLYTDKPAQPVSLSQFTEMLGVLPPLKHTHRGGMESFLMAERLTGSITSMYARMGEACLHKHVDLCDRSTWITPADFAQCMTAA